VAKILPGSSRCETGSGLCSFSLLIKTDVPFAAKVYVLVIAFRRRQGSPWLPASHRDPAYCPEGDPFPLVKKAG
jgi:hypothetical protein